MKFHDSAILTDASKQEARPFASHSILLDSKNNNHDIETLFAPSIWTCLKENGSIPTSPAPAIAQN